MVLVSLCAVGADTRRSFDLIIAERFAMKKIVISEFMDESAVFELSRNNTVVYDKNLFQNRGELLHVCKDADAVIVRNKTQVDQELLSAAVKMKAVGRLGVGLDNIDTEYCEKHAVSVITARGANSISVAEYVLTGIFYFSRQYYLTTQVKSGAWPRERMIGSEAAGKTLGLIGFGDIARTVAKKASCLDMDIVAYDPYLKETDAVWKEYGGSAVKPCSLEDVLRQADVVSLHIPLCPETKNLFTASLLEKTKKGSIFINSSRGGVVDENALAQLLKKGHFKGAVLDVFANEPLEAENPFIGIENCLLTPHIAGVTEESNARISSLIAREISKILQG